jgi:hypothetical protein
MASPVLVHKFLTFSQALIHISIYRNNMRLNCAQQSLGKHKFYFSESLVTLANIPAYTLSLLSKISYYHLGKNITFYPIISSDIQNKQ